jgi:ABC-type transporter Mla MlaB component
MLRITEETRGEGMLLRLEGSLINAWVPVLRDCYERCCTAPRQLTLNLAELRFADQAGAALLAHLQQQGVSLQQCSPFLCEQMKSVFLSEPEPGKNSAREPGA